MKKITLLLVVTGMLLSVRVFSQTLADVAGGDDTVTALKLIKTGVNPNEADKNGATPLQVACRWGKIPMVKLLLANGAIPDKPRSPKGRTALMVGCAYYSGITIIKMLVEKGADVNAKAGNGTTVLMLAAQSAKSDVVEYLLSHGADANAKDETGKTALDYANTSDPAIYGTTGLPDAKIDKADCIERIRKALGK